MHRRARKGVVRDYEQVIEDVRYDLSNQPMPPTEESLIPILKPQFNRLKKTVKRK